MSVAQISVSSGECGLNNLAAFYLGQGRYAEAEPLYKRSLTIFEKALGPNHPDVATSLNNLAELYNKQSRYAEVEPLFKRSLAIGEKALGPNHPDVANYLKPNAPFQRSDLSYPNASKSARYRL